MERNDALQNNRWHWGNCTRTTGPRGGVKIHVVEVRRTGQNKLWKTRPDDFRVPVAHGLRDHGAITPENVAQFHTLESCPLNDGQDHASDESHVARVQKLTYVTFNHTWYRCVCTCGFISESVRYHEEAELAVRAHTDGAIVVK